MSVETPTTSGQVHFQCEGDIAVLRIDNPPVNAGSIAVRQGLLRGIDAARDANCKAAVILGAGRCFMAGADLREFGQPLQKPELPDVIRAIEAAPFPVVAALHGVALGGGLELSLGCDYRLAATDTKLGLPEVSLGFVPGAGGTQRLPRLVGVATAIDLICAASHISAQLACRLGLIDAVTKGDLLETALRFLRTKTRPKRLVKDLSPPPQTGAAIENAAQKALKRGKGRPNVAEAIRLVRLAETPAPDAALADERAVFQKLRLSDEAFALRHLFFAERKAARVDGLDLKAARPVETVGVIGGGTMGQGIARVLLGAGLHVTLIERDRASLEASRAAIEDALEAKVQRGRLADTRRQSMVARLAGGTDLSALNTCDLVIEAVFEDMEVKTALLTDLEAVLPPEAILATNTFYLDVDAMAAGLARPDRVIGLHFFSPADVMKLLEVVNAGKTSDATLATALKLARRLDKQPVVTGVGEGFVGNRIYAAYRGRAELLVLDGATPHQVDAAATAFGFAMGPFAVSDMSGLDIAWATRKRLAATRDPKARYVTLADSLCEAGRLGRKTGAGWYDYSTGGPLPDPAVDAMIDAARRDAGVQPQPMDEPTIQRQLLAAIVNEAARVLEDRIAQRPSDIDVVLTNGYGFPRWRGGPLYWAAQQDADTLAADLDALAHAVGHGFVAGPVFAVLSQFTSVEH